MSTNTHRFKWIARTIGTFVLFCGVTASAGPIDTLSKMPADVAGEVTLKCTHEHPPLGKNREAAEWYGSQIFKNEIRTPRIEISDAEFEKWVDTASKPFTETGKVVMTWAQGCASHRTTFAKSILCPIGRDHYFAGDGERLVEHMTEGDFNYFTVRGPNPGAPGLNDALWSAPHGGTVLYPLAWFEESNLKMTATKTAGGVTEIAGESETLEPLVSGAFLRTDSKDESAITEIRYLYHRPHGGVILVEGLMSDHKEIAKGVVFPHHIVWTTRLVRKDQKTPDLSQPIEFDPYVHTRWTLDVISAKCGPVRNVFKNGFLPEAPADATYVDFRFPRGSEARMDPLYQDYRDF